MNEDGPFSASETGMTKYSGTVHPSSGDDLAELFSLHSQYRTQLTDSLRRIRKRRPEYKPSFAVETFEEFCHFWQQLRPRDRDVWRTRLRNGYAKELERIREVMATPPTVTIERRSAA